MLKIAISLFPAFNETELLNLKGETVPFPDPLAAKYKKQYNEQKKKVKSWFDFFNNVS